VRCVSPATRRREKRRACCFLEGQLICWCWNHQQQQQQSEAQHTGNYGMFNGGHERGNDSSSRRAHTILYTYTILYRSSYIPVRTRVRRGTYTCTTTHYPNHCSNNNNKKKKNLYRAFKTHAKRFTKASI